MTKLIGFSNGTFDLEQDKFILDLALANQKVGYSFRDLCLADPVVLEIEKFFSQIFTDSNTKTRFLRLISSFLDDSIENKKIVIFNGSGNNGKSTVIQLIETAFGINAGYFPSSALESSNSMLNPKLYFSENRRMYICSEYECDNLFTDDNMKKLNDSNQNFIFTTNSNPDISKIEKANNIIKIHFENVFIIDPIKENKNEFMVDDSLTMKTNSIEWGQAFMWMLIKKYYPEYMKFGLDNN